MDLGADEALDYEDETLEATKTESENEKEMANAKLPSGDDDYLQIDCSEEEEYSVSGERPLESPSSGEGGGSGTAGERPPKPVTSGATAAGAPRVRDPKGSAEGSDQAPPTPRDPGSVKAKKQKIVLGNEDSIPSNAPSDVGRKCNVNGGKKTVKKFKCGKRFWAFPRRPAQRKKLTNNLSVNPWLPQYGFLDGTTRASDGLLGPPPTQTPTPRKAALPALQAQERLQQLLLLNKGLAMSNAVNGIASSSGDYIQQMCKPLISETVGDRSGFLPFQGISGGFRLFDNNLSFQPPGQKNTEKIVSLKNNYIKTGVVQQDIDVTLKQSGKSTQNFLLSDAKRVSFQNGNGIHLKQAGQKCDVQTTVSLPPGQEKYLVTVGALKEDERELVKLKKEARLKRFMQSGVVKKEGKLFEANVDKKPDPPLQMNLAFVKLEKPEVSKEKSTRRGDGQEPNSNCSSSLGTPNLKKEVLLKKQNPFEMTEVGAETKVKQEVLERGDVKVKCEGGKSACVEEQPKRSDESKVLTTEGFGIKQENGPPVKFVRTISKSLVELGFVKPKAAVIDGSGKFPLLIKAVPFADESFDEPMRPQLTGCIVKVFNIPPKTTTNDILSMCGSVGAVREVKLNFPKENSAVIRFAESTSAESFFSLYHGQKMNDYFLNVIVV